MPAKDAELTETLAKRVAVECQWCEKAPKERCVKNCPAEVDIPNFMRKMEVGNWKGAARLIRSMNPFGEICGNICPTERLCESKCYHSDFSNEPVRVGQLQAWVCKQAGTEGWENYQDPSKGTKIAVVGAGPAGLTCAYFLAKNGYIVDIYEKEEKPGGALSYFIPNFRLNDEIVQREISGILTTKINVKYGKALGTDVTIKDLEKDYRAIFLAPGLWEGKKLNILGLNTTKNVDALTFLKAFRKEGKYSLSGNILIIGGGSVAADAASTALKCGAKTVNLVCLESKEEMPALLREIEELKVSGVKIHNSWGPKEISNGKLTCICCTSVFDDNNKFCPEFDEAKKMEIQVDYLILAVGQTVETTLKMYLENEFGSALIKVNPETQLIEGRKNIYAGGDIVRGAGTVVEAVADGRRAARSIEAKLRGK